MNRVARGIALLGLSLFAVLPAAAQLPKPTKIVIVFEENKGYEDVITVGDASGPAPYLTSLAKGGASITAAAFHHPSQPNYIEFFYGTNQLTFPCSPAQPPNLQCAACVNGVTQCVIPDDTCWLAPTSSPSILNQLKSKFMGYAEDWTPSIALNCCPEVPAGCGTPLPPGNFARKHCPWIGATNGLQFTQPFSAFAKLAPSGFTALPPLSIVIPNLLDDMHSGANTIPGLVTLGDSWLKANLASYAQWAMLNNSLLIVTWDENSGESEEGADNGKGFRPPDNHIPTIFYGAVVQPGTNGGNVVYTHYDLQLTVMQMLGLNGVGNAANASLGKPITGIWQTPPAKK